MGAAERLNKLVLIGVGLIGGSFALDLKRLGRVAQVAGVDVDGDNLQRALERGVIDQAHHAIDAAALNGADMVLIATPVAALPAVCHALQPLLPPDALVSDVGSTKRSALAAFQNHLPQHFSRCVAAHPIAGSDRSGALAAQFGLYRGKKLIVCPHSAQHRSSLDTVCALWQAVGAEIYQMNADEHDAVFAAVSHLPHLLAFAYVHQLLDHPQGEHYLQFAGSGFRDFTRIAASHPQMWADIALENRAALLELLNGQQQQLAQLQHCLHTSDRAALLRYFAEAQNLRENWQNHH